MSLYPKSKELKIPIKENTHTHTNPKEQRDLEETLKNLIPWYFSEDSKNLPSDYFLTRQNALRQDLRQDVKIL